MKNTLSYREPKTTTNRETKILPAFSYKINYESFYMKLHTQILLCCSSPLVDLKRRNKPKISFETRYDLAPLLIMTHNLKQA